MAPPGAGQSGLGESIRTRLGRNGREPPVERARTGRAKKRRTESVGQIVGASGLRRGSRMHTHRVALWPMSGFLTDDPGGTFRASWDTLPSQRVIHTLSRVDVSNRKCAFSGFRHQRVRGERRIIAVRAGDTHETRRVLDGATSRMICEQPPGGVSPPRHERESDRETKRRRKGDVQWQSGGFSR